MKKNILAATILLSLGTSAAQAVSIGITTMEFYDETGTPVLASGGFNTSVNTTTLFSITGDGTADSGSAPFLGTPWTITQAMWNETTGVATNWSGNTSAGIFNYDYTLSSGQVAVGLSFNWGVNVDIMILQIFDCSSGINCNGVNWDPAHGDPAVSHAIPGTAMRNGPFADSHATFKAQVVPIPAAVWLFGSGLLSLLGMAHRRKTA